jgi:hypothetical protein
MCAFGAGCNLQDDRAQIRFRNFTQIIPMASETSRRKFIAQTAKAGLGIYVGSGILSSCSSISKITIPTAYTTGFTQDPLPYSYDALEKAIDAKTMELHYTKHAAGYATNLQGAVKTEGVAANTSLENVLQRISKYSVAIQLLLHLFKHVVRMIVPYVCSENVYIDDLRCPVLGCSKKSLQPRG